jgi:small subunit ribosomal protein S20
MPQHKSAEKAMRISRKANLRNRMGRSRLRTVIRTVLDSKDAKSANEALKTAVSVIDKSVDTGLIHKNNAANKKSRLSSFVQKKLKK